MEPVRSGIRIFWLLLLWVFAVACGGPLQRADLAQNPAGDPAAGGVPPQMLTVTLRGTLDTQQLAHAIRSLREAKAHDTSVTAVLFVLDQDAGSFADETSDLQALFDLVQDSGVETVTLVRGRATYGAASLAVLSSRTFFQRGAEIGEIGKPDKDLLELLAKDPDSALGQRLDEAKAVMQERLSRRKTKLQPDAEKMVMAMVDPRVQLVRAIVRESGIERSRLLDETELPALQASGARIVEQTKLTRPLHVDAREAEAAGLSEGTVDSLDVLVREHLRIDPALVGELSVNWAERMVGWLALLQPFLLVGGFLLILFEVKTPGFGLPGVLGAAFLGLALFYSYLTGLAEITEILLFFLGLAALGVEIFLLPGTVFFGAIGFLCLVLALLLSQQSFVLPRNTAEDAILLANLVQLTLLFVTVLVGGAVLWRVLPHVPGLNRLLLQPPPPVADVVQGSGRGVADAALVGLVGRVGMAETVLRPTGTMALDGQRIDVVTEGDFLEAGTALRVLYVQGNRVVVAAAAADGQRGDVGIVLLLAVVGLCLIVAEVFFVSAGMLGILAGVSLLSAVFMAFQDSMALGFTTLLGEAIAAPIVLGFAFKILPKTPFGKQLILSGPETQGKAGAADPGLSALLGKTGIALSALRPAGFARIDGRKVDVVTRGEMLDAGIEIVVLDVTANRVVVARK